MNNVYLVLDWMKANPVLVVCAIIVLASLGVFGYSYTESAAFREELAERESDISTIEGFARTQVTAPGPEPDDAPLELQMVANEGAIEQLRSIYNDLEREYRGIYERATELNRQGHEPMLEGLFPDPGSLQSRRFQAREAYAAAIEDLYEDLNAGSPPTEDEIADLINQEREVMRRELFVERLSEDQEEELEERQSEALFRYLRQHSTAFHIFAEPVTLELRGDWLPGPFDVGEWAQSSNPTMFQIWEGQMNLWIQQDLVKAIATANTPDDPDDSLLTLPVKRLIAMRVLPEYIADEERMVTEPLDESGVESLVSELEDEASDRLPQDFTKSPTGRISNAIYDVRHAEMGVIVDSQQIPQLLNAIDETNFMTVIGMQVENIDEYEHLYEGYYYGKADCVRLELLIETIWLRSWTAGDPSEQRHREATQEQIEQALSETSLPTQQATEEAERLAEQFSSGRTDRDQVQQQIEQVLAQAEVESPESVAAAAVEGLEPFNPGLMPDPVRLYLGLPPREIESSEMLEEDAGGSGGSSRPGGSGGSDPIETYQP